MQRRFAILATPANRDPNVEFYAVKGHGMLPVLASGFIVRVNRLLIEPEDDEIVVLHVEGEGRVIGCWRGGERPLLAMKNPRYAPIDLAKASAWRLIGTVTTVVSRPVWPARRAGDGTLELRCPSCAEYFPETDLDAWAYHTDEPHTGRRGRNVKVANGPSR